MIAKKKTEIVENKYLDIRKEPDPITFHAFAKEYLAWAKSERKPEPMRRLTSLMKQVDLEFENKTLQDITAWQIEKYKVKRKEEGKSPATVNRQIALLKHMFTKAIEWGKLKDNPAKKVKPLKREIRRVRYLMLEEVQRLLSNCADHLKPIVEVAVNTGMRKMELLTLKWDQVNLDQGFITLWETKNSERPDIPMNETVKASLNGIERNGPYIFCDGNGKSFGNVKRSFETALKKSEIEDFRFHDLRHTFASNLIMEGTDITTAKELMGHKTIDMTLRYSHLAPNYKTRAVNILDRIFGVAQNPPQSEKVRNVVSLTR